MNARQRLNAALQCQPVDRPPVWLMRQAGRYLPEYRELRAKHTFLQMVHTPDIATEVTLQPVRRFDMDAAILFSDILTIPEAMGIKVDFPEGGPVLSSTVRSDADLRALLPVQVTESLGFVAQALRQLRVELPQHALLGFSGAPYTLACYMVEGKGSKSFERIKAMLYSAPQLFENLLEKLADVVIDYLQMQLDAGADAVQLFDTWAGELRAEDYLRAVLPSTRRIVQTIRARGGNILLFAKHPGHLLDGTLAADANGIGLDWRCNLADARERGGNHVALQGNLDPIELFAPHAHIRERVRAMYHAAGQGTGYIANLGHGCIPSTPIDGVETFVDAVKNLRATETPLKVALSKVTPL